MKRTGGQTGFTLLEILIFSAIFVVVLAGVYTVYMTSHTTVTWAENKVELQQNARVGLDMAAREIRMAGYDPSNAVPGGPYIEVAGANSITFIGDVTGDNVSDRVVYRLQGTLVMRDLQSWAGAWGATTTSELADGVTALSFAYTDGDDLTADPNPLPLANIRRITIAMTAQRFAGGRTESFPLTIDVRLRNL